jgi:hypothetical protein
MPRGIPAKDRVPNEPLREAFYESGLTWNEVAVRVEAPRAKADALRKALGLTPETRPGGVKYYREYMHERDAVLVAKALHKLPFELGF